MHYLSRESVEAYALATQANNWVLDQLKAHLKAGSSLLELGMGPGHDLVCLQSIYDLTGTDLSPTFLDFVRAKSPKAKLNILDAKVMELKGKFDCIYSNKVLHHLSESELKASLKKQAEKLNEQGILIHTFWEGNTSTKSQALLHCKYSEEKLENLFKNHYSILKICLYNELSYKDSILIIAQLKSL